MRTILTKLRSSAGRFILLLLILSAAMLFITMSWQLYALSVESAQAVERSTVTLVVPGVEESGYRTLFKRQEDGTYAEEKEKIPPLSERVESSVIIGEHDTRTLSGTLGGAYTLLPEVKVKAYERQEMGVYDNSFGSTGALALLTITITDKAKIQTIVEEPEKDFMGNLVDPEKYPTYEVNGQTEYGRYMQYDFKAHVDEVHVLNPNLKAPEEIILRTRVTEETADVTFHVCDQLTVLGRFTHYYQEGSILDQTDLGAFAPTIVPTLLAKNNHWYHLSLQQERYPLIVQPGDPRTAQMQEAAYLNARMMFVTGVEKCEAVPFFAMDEAYLVSGRDFTAEDVSAAAPVCLVNERYAAANELHTGDVLPLAIYQNSVIMTEGPTIDRMKQCSYSISPVLPDAAPLKTIECTIIGTYYTPSWSKAREAFTPNTVFVPITLLPDAERMDLPYADGTIIRNGTGQQFYQDLEDAGLERSNFSLYDGGYTAFMDSLMAMKQDSSFVLMVCAILFVVLTLSAITMMTRHLGGDVALMMKVGAGRRTCRGYMLGCLLPAVALSAIIGYVACALVQQPLLSFVECWYALAAPRFSNLTDTSGVMTRMGQGWPSVTGAATALAAAAAITIASAEAALRERSGR